MHTQDLHMHAGIRPSLAAANASSAREVRIYRYELTLDEPGVDRSGYNLSGELMPDHPGIGEKRVPPREDVVVGAAKPDPVDAHEHLARSELRLRPIDNAQVERLLAYDGLHNSPQRNLATFYR
jgi:hypothetical protein